MVAMPAPPASAMLRATVTLTILAISVDRLIPRGEPVHAQPVYFDSWPRMAPAGNSALWTFT